MAQVSTHIDHKTCTTAVVEMHDQLTSMPDMSTMLLIRLVFFDKTAFDRIIMIN